MVKARCYTDECNQAPFEPFDLTCPGMPPQSRSSRPNLGQVGYPLCFDNDPFCLSYNSFLLITIWTAHIWNRHPAASIPFLAPKSFICHSYENSRGVPKLFPFWNSPLATSH